MADDDLARRLRAHLTSPQLKRFFKTVTVENAAPGFAVALDGWPLKTPQKAQLKVPTRALAEAVAGEWVVQDEFIDAKSMPLTRLVNTAIDRVMVDPARITEEIAAYAESDLVCYRAEGPQALVDRQETVWSPVLAWAEETLGGKFLSVTGLMHRNQPAEAVAAVVRRISGKDAFTLTAIHNMTTLTGSILIALAVGERRLSAPEAWNAAHVDEDWQIEQWGPDAEAHARRAARRRDFDAAVELLSLLETIE